MSSSPLYHYTSAEGFFGIVQNRRLRATEFTFMNDPSEIIFAAQQVRARLVVERDSVKVGSSTHEQTQNILEFLDRIYLDRFSKEQYQEDRAFLTSFSNRDDHLTLWRLYAGPTGYCIGFDKEELVSWMGTTPIVEEQGGTLDPSKVSRTEKEEYDAVMGNFGLTYEFSEIAYGESESKQIIDDVVDLVLSENFSLDQRESELRYKLRKLSSVKHEAFRDERETRLLVQASSCHRAPEVRVSPTLGLVPYYEVHFPHSAVRSVTVAPGPHTSRAVSAVNSMLRDGGRGAWGGVDVRACGIPFAW